MYARLAYCRRLPSWCNLHRVEWATGSGTIDELVADAAARGYQIGARLIRDWTEAGLLDYPQRRPAGKGHGSRPALYSANQRNLLLTLLRHRPTVRFKTLANIPVGAWLYWGDDYVPVGQTRRALKTWVGDPRVSKKQARQTAEQILAQFDNASTTPQARTALLDTVSESAWTGRVDSDHLARVVRDVFEPGAGTIRKAVGHPAAPVMTDPFVEVVKARLAAIDLLKTDVFTDDDFRQARHAHLVTFNEYALQQPLFAAVAPTPDMYKPATAQNAINSACKDLLTNLGLAALHPERAAQITATPQPHIVFGQ